MKVVIPLAALLGLWSLRAFGADITVSASAPTTNVEISQTTISSYSNPEGGPYEAIRKTANSVSAWREVGQTFTAASTFTLDKISLMVSQSDQFPASGLSLYMDVWTAANEASHSGTSLTGFPKTGMIMPTIPRHASTPAPESAIVWMTFDVANVELTPGIYGFRFGNDTADFSINYQLGSSSLDVGGIYLNRGGNPLAGGQMYRFHPSNGTVNSGFTDGLTDLAFIIQSATPQLGDFNTDGKVDAADYVTWRKNDVANNPLPNDNGLTTQSDRFALWRGNFGQPSGSAANLGEAAVPEPTVGVLTVVSGLWSMAIFRRSARRAV
jgi:hypothetical protein